VQKHWIALLTVLFAGCNQDVYRVALFGDGGAALDFTFVEAGTIADAGPADGSVDRGPSDLGFDACRARSELCNNIDDNCNDQVDEGFDKLGDVRFCEDCQGCQRFYALFAVPRCDNGRCAVDRCAAGHVDLDGDPKNGCEYPCTKTALVEICDGVDNDCNGKVDDLITTCATDAECAASYGFGSTCDGQSSTCSPPPVCNQIGPCAGAEASCQGQLGWVCQYAPEVELQRCERDEDCGLGVKCQNKQCPGVVTLDETRCDGQDGDCDGVADDPWKRPGLATAIGKPCDPSKPCTTNEQCGGAGSSCQNSFCTPKLGPCRDVGVYACDAQDDSQTACVLSRAGAAPAQETCNNVDDNCDGVVDDDPTDNQWVTVSLGGGKSVQIFRYEASRPDASAQAAGIVSDGAPCSVPSRMPWASMTKIEALFACQRIGARLCTQDEWQKACAGPSATEFPYGNVFQPALCNGRSYDGDSQTPGDQDLVLPSDQPPGCQTPWSTPLFNMSGNLKEWVATTLDLKGVPQGFEIRGGAYDTPNIGSQAAALSCRYALPDPEPFATATLRLPSLGFRCCK
jgi:hypothetical protein